MRIPINKTVDLGSLSGQVSTVLGKVVVFSARMPGQVDDKGSPLPGVLIVLDAANGEPLDLPAGDLAAVESAIAAHTPPPPAKTPAENLSAALGTASTVADVRAALKTFAEALVARERGRVLG